MDMTVTGCSFFNNTGHENGGALSLRVSLDASKCLFVF